ncbi:hypothetical protein ACWIUD_07430 [Helicobacter sp. 23-1044]
MDAKSATCINFTKILRNAESNGDLGRFCEISQKSQKLTEIWGDSAILGQDSAKSNKKTQNLR